MFLRSMTCLAIVLALIIVPGMELKSKQKVVGYSHDIPATIAQWACFSRLVMTVTYRVHCWRLLFSSGTIHTS